MAGALPSWLHFYEGMMDDDPHQIIANLDGAALKPCTPPMPDHVHTAAKSYPTVFSDGTDTQHLEALGVVFHARRRVL